MNTAQFVALSESALMLAFLAVLAKWVADQRLDTFRQKMFAVRDELFDYASAGNISFNDPAYRLLRQSMNGFIRYGHQMSFFRILMTSAERWIYGEEQTMTWHSKWYYALQSVRDDAVRDHLLDFQARARELALTRIVLGSPILIVAAVVTAAILIAREGWQNMKRICAQAVNEAVSRTMNTTAMEEDAAAHGAAA